MKFGSFFPVGFPRKRLHERVDLALRWVQRYSCRDGGVAVSSLNCRAYPEVSGYFIPTLLAWGERELARQYGSWLLSIQNEDGSWSDPSGSSPYTFDTGQILKGLVALADADPGYEKAVLRGCDWILGRIESNGRVTTPDTSGWLLPRGKMVPEAIHLYALEPLRVVAQKWGIGKYELGVQRALAYYLADASLTDFDTLSHFHAYIVEALLDLGERERAAEAMLEIATFQSRDGAVPGYKGRHWICSTGLFQYAAIWYRLGELARAEQAYNRACKLQNRSGGFWGGYGFGADYFPREEISWAVKYFMDATRWKIATAFEEDAPIFPADIDRADGRYQTILDVAAARKPFSVLEAGCGKGRFLRCLQQDFPQLNLTGMDISERMLKMLPPAVRRLSGSLLNIPAGDGCFDLVFCVEALEHAVNVSGAIRELCRVTAAGGTVVIIDKNHDLLGRLKISEWEQWFHAETIADELRQEGLSVTIRRNIAYEGRDGRDGLFLGWIAEKRR